MLAFRSILVPIDGSVNSRRALAYAGYIAGLCQATVGVLHVVNLSAQVPVLNQISMGGYVPDRVLEDAQESGRSVISEALGQLPATTSSEGFLEIGLPSDVIVAFCIEHAYDVIVMGSRGLGEIKQLVLGSVSNHVLHHVPCPVMVVK